MEMDQQRLRTDIEENAEFGSLDVERGRGRTVLTGSEADRKARERLIERMEDAGLEIRVDPVGNVAGRWVPEGVDPDASAVAAGSHLDSVPRGGIFDGPLGVYGALEAVRAIQEHAADPARPLEVVSFTEEEGARFDVGLLGSSVAAGHRGVDDALTLTDDDGTTLADQLNRIGYRGSDRIDPEEWDAWFEIHVEQGTVLEREGVPVGVVDGISGITNCKTRVVGEADHAGGTTMEERMDALTAASEFVLDVEMGAREASARSDGEAVGTVGELTVSPNARNIVPGRVEMNLDLRSTEYERMNEMVDYAQSSLDRISAERPVETELERDRDQRPTEMSDRCLAAAREAAERAGIQTRDMHSAALHDTANVAPQTDAAMLFAPSKDGVSHNPLEWTDWADCARAVGVLAGAMVEVATV